MCTLYMIVNITNRKINRPVVKTSSSRSGTDKRGKCDNVAPDVVVFDLTVWKVPEDPLMLDTETTTSK